MRLDDWIRMLDRSPDPHRPWQHGSVDSRRRPLCASLVLPIMAAFSRSRSLRSLWPRRALAKALALAAGANSLLAKVAAAPVARYASWAADAKALTKSAAAAMVEALALLQRECRGVVGLPVKTTPRTRPSPVAAPCGRARCSRRRRRGMARSRPRASCVSVTEVHAVSRYHTRLVGVGGALPPSHKC